MNHDTSKTSPTAADKMMKVLEAESAAGHKSPFTA